jgi:hypothetical protein
MITPYARAGKEFAERLWDTYHPHADSHFLTEIRRDFHARFWEMYLTCTLLEQGQQQGYSVRCPKYRTGGPDICVEYRDLRIWVEAVTPTDGNPTKPDSVIEPTLCEAHKIPEEKIILRYTNAINSKHKQYLKYLADGIVAENDAYVIAVNGFPLSYGWATPEIPRILKAVFPIGPVQVEFDRNTGKVVKVGHQFRPIIYKSTGEKVSTEFFVNSQYDGISAILHSYANACMMVPLFPEELVDQQDVDQLGNDFFVVHNPMALQPVPHRLIVATRECWATPVDDQSMELSITPDPHSTPAGPSISDILKERSQHRRYWGSHKP